MLSYHAVMADRAMLKAAKLASDTICAACAEDNPFLSVVVHGIPVVVCNAACEQDLVEYWAPSVPTKLDWFHLFIGKIWHK